MRITSNQVGDMLTNRIANMIANDELREEAIEMKAEYIEKMLMDGENVMGYTLESIADTVLSHDLATKAVTALFLYDRTVFFKNEMQAELSRVALEIAPKLVAAEQEY
ncbi:hypothetical protein [Shewanella sp. T24-MNA-CIBAN-0130]|uniref:hypothetical protein n=1 Tax=Shewanella sp. T24-MNA-CIBAN-0130 TaxID=3140470 RepID=UPI0033307B16